MLNRPIYIDLEGADLTGKSTLLKMTFKEGDFSKIMCFHDRGILTHYVYNVAFNRFPEDHVMWVGELIKFVKHNGIIILIGGRDELTKRFKERSDDCFKLESILRINEEYASIYQEVLYKYPTVKCIVVNEKTPIEVYREAEKHYYYMVGRGAA